MTRIEQLVQTLSPELQREVEDFAQFLVEQRHSPQPFRFLRPDWGSGLREFRDQYSALQLQQKGMEWRGDSSCT